MYFRLYLPKKTFCGANLFCGVCSALYVSGKKKNPAWPVFARFVKENDDIRFEVMLVIDVAFFTEWVCWVNKLLNCQETAPFY